MTENKKITMWIEWSDEDAVFIGYCPQFFPYGAVCHGISAYLKNSGHFEVRSISSIMNRRGRRSFRTNGRMRFLSMRWTALPSKRREHAPSSLVEELILKRT